MCMYPPTFHCMYPVAGLVDVPRKKEDGPRCEEDPLTMLLAKCEAMKFRLYGIPF